MSTEITPPPLTRHLSDALIDALSRWTRPAHNDQEDDRA